MRDLLRLEKAQSGISSVDGMVPSGSGIQETSSSGNRTQMRIAADTIYGVDTREGVSDIDA
jgi:hypothetical protein